MSTAAPVSSPARRLAVAAGLAVIPALALVETVNALVQPALAPTDDDWRAAAADVRAGFRPGDLVVAAPAWADQVMRLHLGDLVPQPLAGRMDAARFARVWELSQRGAAADEARTGHESSRTRHGGLTVRLVERAPAAVTYDFLAHWQDAHVIRRSGAGEVACPLAGDRHQCPELAWNWLKPALLELGGTLRNALYVQPVGGSIMSVEFPAVPLGTELAFAAGLHHVWLRKVGDGHVKLRVFVDGREVAAQDTSNRTGFQLSRADTTPWAGRTVPVRFEITSEKPFSRHFGFVAEARTPAGGT